MHRGKITSAVAVAVLSVVACVTAPAAAAADVAWAPCAEEWLGGLECATVEVPKDYGDPAAGTITIAISRHKATDPDRRRGVLFTNPGGPGGAGRWLAADYASQPIAAVYDIIGIDPRGTGASTPLRCDATRPTGSVMLLSRPTDDELGLFSSVAHDREVACEKGGGDFRRFVTTAGTARDMDGIRAALSEEKISYLGVSYGTWLGAVYGQLFPGRLDRSVLDSSVDPTKTWYEQYDDNNKSVEFNFTQWAQWVAKRNSAFGLGKTPEDVRAAVDAISAHVAANPGFAGIINRDDFDAAVGKFTRYRPYWAAFAENISAVTAQRNGAPADPDLATANTATGRMIENEANEPDENGVFATATCDWETPTDQETYYAGMRRWRDSFPYGGTVASMAPTTCAYYPHQGEAEVNIGARQYPTGLVLNADGDPQTSLVSAKRMATTLDEPLITVTNEGAHGVYGMTDVRDDSVARPNTCVDNLVNAYLIDGTLPDGDQVCATSNPAAHIPADGTPITGTPADEPDLAALAKRPAEHPRYGH
ncbi:alpha/beta fold hydrolase [Amycolatopsis speibonae]|uniref:Alpha/beta fold hydrolase n=1 Tax=Amycolatopsis speibonae TaxID=1450224 RepID=A0ABV7P4I7_9PSEU